MLTHLISVTLQTMPLRLSFFTDEKTEPWVYEKYTVGHTVNAGGAGTQIQLDPENHFSLETKYLHMKAVLMALTICWNESLRTQRTPVWPEVLGQNSTGKRVFFPSW